MTLTLRAVSLNDQPLTQPITARFDAQGGTIGRADHNTMALPDPERHISREQAEISAGDAGYVIRNVGSSNPVVVRERPLGRGEWAPLAHRDVVRIGRYLLEVVDEGAALADPAATAPMRAGAELSFPTPSRAVAAPPLAPGNPFADLLGPAAGAGAAPPAFPGPGDAPSTPAPPRLPDDFDPFALPATPAAAPQQRAAPAGSFGDLIPSAAPPSSIDDLFGLKDGGGADPLAAFLSDAQPAQGQAPAGSARSTDPLVLLGAAAAPVLAAEVAADRTPELHAAFHPPRAARPTAPPAAPAQACASPAPGVVRAAAAEAAAPRSGDAAALWTAFCEGAGVKADAVQQASPELMRLVGALLRAAVGGTLQLMAVRAATRHELHAQVTVIQSRNNNPLKFSPDAQAALEQLLQPPLRGFLPGPAAVTEAMDDLVGHAIGTMAGTRSALEGVLARFAPDALEHKLTARSVVDSVLPMARKARLWDLYLQHHHAIRDEAQEDFHALFGKAFLAAYEQQVERLRQERRPA